MEVMVLLLTVTGAVAVTLLLFDLAVMVVVPKATPVTRPELLMVATFGEEEVQVTCEVTSPDVLLPKVAVAVNCCVVVGVIKALVGDKVIAVISVDEGKNPSPQLLSSRAVKTPAATLPHHTSRCTLVVLIVPKVKIILKGKPVRPAIVSRLAQRPRQIRQLFSYLNLRNYR